MSGVCLDAGGLIAVERGDPRMIALLDRLAGRGSPVSIPAGALAQVWRDGSRQARLARLANAPQTEVVPLDHPAARAIGAVCGASGTSDVVEASVVVCARERAQAVVTSDPDDLTRIDPGLTVHRI